MLSPIVKTFDQPGDFAAVHEAEAYLMRRGFSVGRMQANAPRGILWGDFDIAKWRNMTPDERGKLHGSMVGGRSGPVEVRIYSSAPAEVRDAFNREDS